MELKTDLFTLSIITIIIKKTEKIAEVDEQKKKFT